MFSSLSIVEAAFICPSFSSELSRTACSLLLIMLPVLEITEKLDKIKFMYVVVACFIYVHRDCKAEYSVVTLLADLLLSLKLLNYYITFTRARVLAGVP